MPVFRGVNQLEKGLRAESRRQKKALATAVKVEGYRLRKVLQREIYKGSPGGQKFAPLSMIARKRKKGPKRPLTSLAKAVRYHIANQDPIEIHVGWAGPGVSKSWKRIAEKHQAGFDINVSRQQRRVLAGYGGKMGRSKYKPFFFVRSDTSKFTVPARPITEPFWDAHEIEARRNITRNYQRKLRGERI